MEVAQDTFLDDLARLEGGLRTRIVTWSANLISSRLFSAALLLQPIIATCLPL
jgi:hypothetical protein